MIYYIQVIFSRLEGTLSLRCSIFDAQFLSLFGSTLHFTCGMQWGAIISLSIYLIVKINELCFLCNGEESWDSWLT